MTRKHFKELAEIIRVAKNNHKECLHVIEEIQEDIADFCKRHNSNFKRETFEQACEATK